VFDARFLNKKNGHFFGLGVLYRITGFVLLGVFFSWLAGSRHYSR
jgi:hypothetical protein